MKRRTLLLSALAAPFACHSALAVSPIPPEFEITLARIDDWMVEVREDILRWPWQTRAVRLINGREFEWCALSDRYPTEKDLARYRAMADAAFERARRSA